MKYITAIEKDTATLSQKLGVYILEGDAYVLPPVTLDRFTVSVARLLKVDTGAVKQSLAYLRETPLTHSELYDLCWRLRANKNRLLRGEPVLKYTSVAFEEECVIRFCTNKSTDQDNMWRLGLEVLTGHFARNKMHLLCHKYKFYKMVRLLGYSSSAMYMSDYPWYDILGLRAVVALRPHSDDRPEGIHDQKKDAGVIAWNRKNIIRRRIGYDRCPYGKGEGHCPRCTYTMATCPASYRYEITLTPNSEGVCDG